MAKCSCKDCDLEVFENSDKCILHCDKTKYHKEENGKQKCQEKVLNLFEEAFENYSKINLSELLLEDIHFPANSILKLMYKLEKIGISIIGCKFYGNEELILNKKDIESIYFYKNTTKYNFKFTGIQTKNLVIQACDLTKLEINVSKINRLVISNFLLEVEKEKQINIEEIFINGTEIDNCNINKIELNNLYMNDSKIGKIFFSELIADNIILRANIFLDRLFFSNIKLKNCIDLETTSIPQNTIFFDLEFIALKNRETARIIKDSFEQQNNIIEANKYYALEMKKIEEELKEDLKNGKNFFEWLIFKIHGISSNHSQDWLLALFWILNITFSLLITQKSIEIFGNSLIAYIPIITMIVLGVITSNIDDKKILTIFLFLITFLNFGVFKIILKEYNLDYVAQKINPFSIMTELSNIDFVTFIYKIIIAYLIYQFIVSIRQNTRRK